MNKQLTLVPNTISQKQYCTEKAHLFGSRLVLGFQSNAQPNLSLRVVRRRRAHRLSQVQ
jgi:hypothetical protein